MKIAVSSDWHGRKPNSEARDVISSCDALLLCGDIFEASLNNDKLENYFRQLKKDGKRVIMTPGNHDFGIYFAQYPIQRISYRRMGGCAGYSMEYLEKLGIECLIDQSVYLNGTKIFGTPWTPLFCNWAFMLPDGDALAEKYSLIPEGVDIVISHGPPFDPNSKIDSCSVSMYDGQPEHLGSKMLYNAILEKKPKWFFCGHIHSGQHEETMIGDTRCYNVSYLGEDYQPTFPIRVIEI